MSVFLLCVVTGLHTLDLGLSYSIIHAMNLDKNLHLGLVVPHPEAASPTTSKGENAKTLQRAPAASFPPVGLLSVRKGGKIRFPEPDVITLVN